MENEWDSVTEKHARDNTKKNEQKERPNEKKTVKSVACLFRIRSIVICLVKIIFKK